MLNKHCYCQEHHLSLVSPALQPLEQKSKQRVQKKKKNYTLGMFRQVCKVVIKVEPLKVSTAEQSLVKLSYYSVLRHSVTDCICFYSTQFLTLKRSFKYFSVPWLKLNIIRSSEYQIEIKRRPFASLGNRWSRMLFTYINKNGDEWRLSKLYRTWCKLQAIWSQNLQLEIGRQ